MAYYMAYRRPYANLTTAFGSNINVPPGLMQVNRSGRTRPSQPASQLASQLLCLRALAIDERVELTSTFCFMKSSLYSAIV